MGVSRSLFQDLGLTLDRWVFEPKIETSTPQRIADPANFVRGQHHEGLALRLDRADLRDGQLPVAQDLEEFRFELFTDLVDFIDQQNARLLTQERPQEWSFLKEFQRVQIAP